MEDSDGRPEDNVVEGHNHRWMCDAQNKWWWWREVLMLMMMMMIANGGRKCARKKYAIRQLYKEITNRLLWGCLHGAPFPPCRSTCCRRECSFAACCDFVTWMRPISLSSSSPGGNVGFEAPWSTLSSSVDPSSSTQAFSALNSGVLMNYKNITLTSQYVMHQKDSP